jgi:hypothetical protein
MHGKEFFLTPEAIVFIREASAKGMLEKDIAKGLGLSARYFSNEIKPKFPEIDELIAEGRQLGRERLLEISWEAIMDKKDPARNQELQRLNRKLKTEEPEGTDADGKNNSLGGFEVVIIPKKVDGDKPE